MSENKLPSDFFKCIDVKFSTPSNSAISCLNEKRGLGFGIKEERDNTVLYISDFSFLELKFDADFFFDKYRGLYFVLLHNHFDKKELALNRYYEIKGKLEVEYINIHPQSDFESITYILEDGTVHLTVAKKNDEYSVELGYVEKQNMERST
jgi:hypothetical protein